MPELFTIPPASAKPLWVVAAIGALLLSLLLFFAYVVYASRATQYEISRDGLAVRRTPYGRTIPWPSLDVAQARVVDLRNVSELRPTLRTNGIGLPGYQAGWFRLGERGRGLLFVTDPSRVVALPTRDGFTLLLSVQEPAAFLEAIRRAATQRSG
jgi:hypothetical protein